MEKTENLDKQIDEVYKRVMERLALKIPHVCQTCDWFQLSSKPPRNRNCQVPRDLTMKDFKKGVCQIWKLAEDLGARQPRNLTV